MSIRASISPDFLHKSVRYAFIQQFGAIRPTVPLPRMLSGLRDPFQPHGRSPAHPARRRHLALIPFSPPLQLAFVPAQAIRVLSQAFFPQATDQPAAIPGLSRAVAGARSRKAHKGGIASLCDNPAAPNTT